MPYRTPAFQDWAIILGLFFYFISRGASFFHSLVFPRAGRKRSLGCSGLQLPAQGPVYVEDALRSGDTLIPRESARCGSIRDLPSFCCSRGRQLQQLLALHSCSRTIFFFGLQLQRAAFRCGFWVSRRCRAYVKHQSGNSFFHCEWIMDLLLFFVP